MFRGSKKNRAACPAARQKNKPVSGDMNHGTQELLRAVPYYGGYSAP